MVTENIEAALAANDADLAGSLVDLAREKNVPVPDELSRRVGDAVAEANSPSHLATHFASGLLTGNTDDVASMFGTIAGDLFVFGDIRDVVREGKHLAMGEDTDRLVLGLAAAGLAVTAATYVSIGGAAPVRAGLTLVKDARKVGRLGEGLTQWASRSARDAVDAPTLENAIASGSVLRPGQTLTAIKASFRTEQVGGLVRLAKDVGRVGEKAGTRGALDALISPKARRTSRAPHGSRNPRAGRPARFSRSWAAAHCCWRLARSISRCGYSARCWRCSDCCRRSRPPPSV